MSTQSNAVSTTASTALSTLPFLGPPPLLKGEDPAVYNDLLARITGALKPADIVEEIWVREIVDLTWEAQRWRRLRDAFIESELPKVLARIPAANKSEGRGS
jgi:hypothetical protein